MSDTSGQGTQGLHLLRLLQLQLKLFPLTLRQGSFGGINGDAPQGKKTAIFEDRKPYGEQVACLFIGQSDGLRMALGCLCGQDMLIIGTQTGSRCAVPYLIIPSAQLVRRFETGVLLKRFVDVKINSLGVFHECKPRKVPHECIKKGLALLEVFEGLFGFRDIEHDAHQTGHFVFGIAEGGFIANSSS